MRVVAGTLRGRPLAAPKHEGLRPTSDRVRESVFNVLAHGVPDFDIAGARVIDMFAGTGALGIEALSRGAAYCLFVEEAAEARALIRQNIESFGLTGVTRIFRRDATDLGPAGNMPPYRLAFLDPPYGKGLVERGLGISVLPKLATPPGEHPIIVTKPIHEPEIKRTIGIVERRAGRLSPAGQRFRDMLTEHWRTPA